MKATKQGERRNAGSALGSRIIDRPIFVLGLPWGHREDLQLGPVSVGSGLEGSQLSQTRAEGPQRGGRCGRPWQGAQRVGPRGGPAASSPKRSLAACHPCAPLPASPQKWGGGRRQKGHAAGLVQRGCLKCSPPLELGVRIGPFRFFLKSGIPAPLWVADPLESQKVRDEEEDGG